MQPLSFFGCGRNSKIDVDLELSSQISITADIIAKIIKVFVGNLLYSDSKPHALSRKWRDSFLFVFN